MAADFRGFIGQVPREFQRAYRDRARFLEAGWAGFEPPGVFLHPDDPLYEKLCGAYAREYLKRFGTDHLWASQSYCEMRPGRTPEETLAIELAVARKNLQAIRAVDPEAVLFTTSWTFLDRSGENALAFLKALPADGYQVWDMPSDVQGSGSLYRQLDYYCGKPWLLGYLFAYGGTTMLHGDPAEMIRRAQAVSKDPKAGRCRGICVQPEALRHNAIAFDLLSRLAWDPAEVELEAFVEDYAVRRYGKASAAKMVACFRELLASVYGEPGILCPLYMLRISNEHLGSGRAYGAAQAQRFVPRLQRAIELALEERDRAGAGPLYRRDLIDVTRQWLSDLFNLHVARLAKAFRGGDRGSLVREAESLREILDSQQRLLSSSEEFCLAPILAKARKLPHAPADMEERIRDVLTIWAGKILDYAHRDYYELVRFYYRKRVEAFLAHAQSRLGTRAAMIDPAQLTPLYAAIEQDWVKRPFVVLPQEKYQGTPVEAVAEILKKHRLGEAELAKLAAETF